MMNSGRTKSGSKPWWHRASLAGLLTVAVLAAATATPVFAADDDEDEAIDTKFLRGMLEGLGLRRDGDAGIDYRERSPLVVPSGRSLPQPVSGNAAAKVPAWPTDPDVKRVKDAKAERKKPRKSIEDESRPELPGELGRGVAGAGSRAGQSPVGNQHKDPEALSSQKELGSKNIFTWGALWGSNKQEYATFTSEPPRSSLTEPPAGYRTPSPAQPYGVGSEKYLPGAINPMDTPAMRGQ